MNFSCSAGGVSSPALTAARQAMFLYIQSSFAGVGSLLSSSFPAISESRTVTSSFSSMTGTSRTAMSPGPKSEISKPASFNRSVCSRTAEYSSFDRETVTGISSIWDWTGSLLAMSRS